MGLMGQHLPSSAGLGRLPQLLALLRPLPSLAIIRGASPPFYLHLGGRDWARAQPNTPGLHPHTDKTGQALLTGGLWDR